jgi:hypothetical protein
MVRALQNGGASTQKFMERVVATLVKIEARNTYTSNHTRFLPTARYSIAPSVLVVYPSLGVDTLSGHTITILVGHNSLKRKSP